MRFAKKYYDKVTKAEEKKYIIYPVEKGKVLLIPRRGLKYKKLKKVS